MKKNGIIPPHFLYFLENEGIEVTEFKSSNLISKDSYDRMIVKFPYSVRTLDIQIIFDNLDYSSPPDFLFVKESGFMVSYNDIIKDWNFKESSSLYNILLKLKDFYAMDQELKLKQENKNIKSPVNSSKNLEYTYNNLNTMYEYINKILSYVRLRFNSYKNINKQLTFLDIIHDNGSQNIFELPDKLKNHVIISYPLDIIIRSRNIKKSPIINIYIPLTFDYKFYLDLTTPNFILFDLIQKNQQEYYDISNFQDCLIKYENYVTDFFKQMHTRETIVNKILDANVGFPIEIDSYSFNKFSLYFHYNKNSMSLLANSSFKGKSINGNLMQNNIQNNFILHFIFNKEESNKFEFQIVDCDKLNILIRKKIEFGLSEREVNNMLQNIFHTLFEHIQPKKK